MFDISELGRVYCRTMSSHFKRKTAGKLHGNRYPCISRDEETFFVSPKTNRVYTYIYILTFYWRNKLHSGDSKNKMTYV